MSFAIVTDSTANLTVSQLKEYDITEIVWSYFSENQEYSCSDLESFDDKKYYDSIRNGAKITTSQINPQQYISTMKPLLEAGRDVLFIGLSSGISGSFSSAMMAKEQLNEAFPERQIELIDSLGAGLGKGLLVIRAAKCRENGMELKETAERILSFRDRVYQVFIVDDLMHLKRTGRLSNIGAVVGTLLGIKPLLKGNENGKIAAFEKIRGRKQSIKALAEKYFTLAKNAAKQTIGITYADCKADAEYLAKLIKEKLPPKEILMLKHEPVTGSHIGPGALALFFEGEHGVRLK